MVEAYPLAVATADRWAPYAQELASIILSEISGPNIPSPATTPISQTLQIYDVTMNTGNYFNIE